MAERAKRLSDDVPTSTVAAMSAPGPATSDATSSARSAYSRAADSSGPSDPGSESATDAHPHIAETAGHRRMSGVADLERLALAAIGRAPDGHLVGPGERVEGRPELRPDPGVGGIAQQAPAPAVLDL